MSTQASNEVQNAIAAANRQFMDAFAGRNAAGMAALYTTGGQLLPPGSDFVTGAPAIQSFWQTVMDMGIEEATLETVELEAHGDTAYEVGRFTLRAGGRVLDSGKYVVIWKQEGGSWKLHRDIWNSSRPAG